MPYLTNKVCKCGMSIPGNINLCPDCLKRYKRSLGSNKSRYERGYTRQHDQIRKIKKRQYPICEICGKRPSNDLHHKDGNPFNRADDNLQMLCRECHNKITPLWGRGI